MARMGMKKNNAVLINSKGLVIGGGEAINGDLDELA